MIKLRIALSYALYNPHHTWLSLFYNVNASDCGYDTRNMTTISDFLSTHYSRTCSLLYDSNNQNNSCWKLNIDRFIFLFTWCNANYHISCGIATTLIYAQDPNDHGCLQGQPASTQHIYRIRLGNNVHFVSDFVSQCACRWNGLILHIQHQRYIAYFLALVGLLH